jgi:hypothetical protein
VYLEHSLFGIADTDVIANGPCHSVAEEEEKEEEEEEEEEEEQEDEEYRLSKET